MYRNFVIFFWFQLLLLLSPEYAVTKKNSHGFNDAIVWYDDLEEGKRIAKEENKPMAVLIHKTWCGACKGLKKSCAESSTLPNAAEKYVMVNLVDDDEPSGPEFKGDGGYIPRLFFFDSAGNAKPELKAIGGHPDYAYFYANANILEKTLKEILPKLIIESTTESEKKENVEAADSTEEPQEIAEEKMSGKKEPKDTAKGDDVEVKEGGEEAEDESEQKQTKEQKKEEKEKLKAEKKAQKEKKKKNKKKGESRGFNDDIDWLNSIEDGKALAQKKNKPMIVLIHKAWCSACKNLKASVAASKSLVKISKKYIMVNLLDDEEPKDEEFNQDGTYIPRMFFFDSEGKIRPEFKTLNGNPKYGYFYPSADAIEKTMIDTLPKIKLDKPKEKKTSQKESKQEKDGDDEKKEKKEKEEL